MISNTLGRDLGAVVSAAVAVAVIGAKAITASATTSQRGAGERGCEGIESEFVIGWMIEGAVQQRSFARRLEGQTPIELAVYSINAPAWCSRELADGRVSAGSYSIQPC